MLERAAEQGLSFDTTMRLNIMGLYHSYSYSKLADEMLLASYTSAYGARTYAVRTAGIWSEERCRRMAERTRLVQGWNTRMSFLSNRKLRRASRLGASNVVARISAKGGLVR